MRRQLFESDERHARGRMSLRRALAAQATAVIALVAATVLPGVPSGVHVAAALVATFVVGLSLAVFRALTLEEDRRRHEAETYVDLAQTMLIAVDREARVTMANPQACRVAGRDEPDMLGRPIYDLMYDEADTEDARASYARILSGEVDPSAYVSRRQIHRPDGTSRWVDWHIAPRRGADGRLRGVLVSGTDVTDMLVVEQRLEREAVNRSVLHGLTQLVASGADARQGIVDALRELLGAGAAVLAEPGDDGAWRVTHGTDARRLGAQVSVTTSSEPRLVDDPGLGRSVLACAVTNRGAVVGILAAGWPSEFTPDPDVEQLMELVAQEAALALRTLSDREELEVAALTDPLTSVANRRAFDSELAAAIARARRTGGRLALVTMDLNRFKALNDQRGHEAGDRVLVACARAWSDLLRGGDTLARLGGDEFAAVLPDCDPAAAEDIAARIRRSTPHRGGSSVGVVSWSGEGPDELSALADRALYADKAASRSRAVQNPARLAAVAATGRWDAPRSETLDAIAGAAAEALRLPVYVTLVGEERLVYAGKANPDDADAGRPLSHAFCQRAVTSAQPVVIADAREDPSTAANPGVADGMVAYAGIPLTVADGHVLGALCAVDSGPRAWTQDELMVMHQAADAAVEELQSAVGRV